MTGRPLPALALLASTIVAPLGHPQHASTATLHWTRSGAIEVTVRVFADDLQQAAPGGDSAAVGYLRRHFRLTDTTGRPIALTIHEVRRNAESVHLSGRTAPLTGAVMVCHALFWELFKDQVNIVRAQTPSGRARLVFGNGDAPRLLR
jgi:ketosteroid isomerase-like protein